MYTESWSVFRVPSCGQNIAPFAEHLYIKQLNVCRASLLINMEYLQSFLIWKNFRFKEC